MTPEELEQYQDLALRVHRGKEYHLVAELAEMQKRFGIDCTPKDMAGWAEANNNLKGK